MSAKILTLTASHCIGVYIIIQSYVVISSARLDLADVKTPKNYNGTLYYDDDDHDTVSCAFGDSHNQNI